MFLQANQFPNIFAEAPVSLMDRIDFYVFQVPTYRLWYTFRFLRAAAPGHAEAGSPPSFNLCCTMFRFL